MSVVCDSAAIWAEKATLTEPRTPPFGAESDAQVAEARAAFERDYLITLLKLTRGQVSEVARLAGRNRTEVYRLLQRHGLTPALFKDRDDS